jgi:hypothetical protein
MSTQPARPRYALVTIVLATASTAHADEFSWQLSGGLSRYEFGPSDADNASVDATYYVNPIDDADGPYALASFLNPTTRVSAAASEHATTSTPSFFPLGGHPTAYTVAGRYVWPNAKWYAGASHSRGDFDGVPGLVEGTDPKAYSVLAGKYLGASTTIELAAGSSEQRWEQRLQCAPVPLCPVPLVIETETETDIVSLEVFHVGQFRSLTYSLEGGIAETDAEIAVRSTLPFNSFGPGGVDSRVYSVAGELFPTTRLGVRLGYSRPDAEDGDVDAYSVATTWFFKPRVAVQFSYLRSTQEGGSALYHHADTAAVRFIGRL